MIRDCVFLAALMLAGWAPAAGQVGMPAGRPQVGAGGAGVGAARADTGALTSAGRPTPISVTGEEGAAIAMVEGNSLKPSVFFDTAGMLLSKGDRAPTWQRFCPASLSNDLGACFSHGFLDLQYHLIRDTHGKPEWRLLQLHGSTAGAIAKFSSASKSPPAVQGSCYVIRWRFEGGPYADVPYESRPIRLGPGKATRDQGNGCK